MIRDLHWSTWVGVLVVSAVALALHVRFTRRAAIMGPTLLTTLGIGFCFLGIALGLFDFDSQDLRRSVPALIDGMRTAFWASVVGIASAISIKIRLLVLGDPPPTRRSAYTLGDIAVELQRLQRAVGGENDAALATLAERLHSDVIERLDKLQDSFGRFAENVVEANTQALIEALSGIMRDFNTKLNEQVGDNFKRLDQAAERLVTWQVQHKTQLEQLLEHETLTANLMGEAARRYADLVNKSTVFLRVAESLAVLLPNLERQTQVLEASARSLGKVAGMPGRVAASVERGG